VAVKICSPRPDLLEPSVFNSVNDRFRREARLSPRVKHPSVITYLDSGEHLSKAFLVMELAEASLRNLLEAHGRLSPAEVARIGCDIAAGLSWLHSQSCVHRDIKPPNVLKLSHGYVLGDLGILKWGELNPSFTNAGTITKSSIQLGSWNYMAPEQVDDAHSAEPASDVYAFGVTLFEMVTGTVPTPHRVVAGDLGSPSDLPKLNRLITQMTSYRAADRPSVAEVHAELASIAPAMRLTS
jgi:serine/threonine protein kinase